MLVMLSTLGSVLKARLTVSVRVGRLVRLESSRLLLLSPVSGGGGRPRVLERLVR